MFSCKSFSASDGCRSLLVLRHLLVSIRARLPSLTIALWRGARAFGMVVIVSTITMVILVIAPYWSTPSPTAGPGSAVVNFRIRIRVGGRGVGRIVVRRFVGSAGLVVYTAYFRRLLAHALVIYNILRPLDASSLGRLGPQTKYTRRR